MEKAVMFLKEADAKGYFGCSVESCEGCGLWTASYADHDEGGIVGPYVDGDGDCVFDRICAPCEEVDDG